jgi:uncharacterized membrane protein
MRATDVPGAAAFDVAAVVLTSSLLLMAGVGVTGWVRTVAALVFVSFVPGWALLGYVSVGPPWSRSAVAVGLSLTVCTAGALVMLWVREWRPYVLFDALAAACLAALLLHLARDTNGRSA